MTANCEEDLFREQLQQGLQIIVIEDQHLIEMLTLLKNREDPISVLEEEYKNLMLQL